MSVDRIVVILFESLIRRMFCVLAKAQHYKHVHIIRKRVARMNEKKRKKAILKADDTER